MSIATDLTMEHLADAVRAEHRAVFNLAVVEGRAVPLVLPFSLLGPFVVPTIWLAIPHARGGWTMQLGTWLVVAFVVVFDLDLIRRTSSTNMAVGYATGLMGFWGIISTLNVLVWHNMQTDAARIVRREKPGPVDQPNGHANGAPPQDGLRMRRQDLSASSSAAADSELKTHQAEYEHVWEPFPADAPFGQRFNWALDMTTNFRFAGWNMSISAIPRPTIPLITPIKDGTSVDMSSIPVTTTAGYRRYLTQSGFVRNRLFTIVFMYFLLDFLAVFMTKDPYFVLGPDHHNLAVLPLPSYLQGLPAWALRTYRQIFSLAGVLGAISGMFNANDLVQYFLLSYIFPSRGELYQHSSTFGSFTQILDRGLAGWWGAWWHQSFRVQFAAPARWLLRKGYIQRDTFIATAVSLLISFCQSGLLHGSGSITSVPRTQIWRTPAFFLLQVVGMLVGYIASSAAKNYLPMDKFPHVLTRTLNLVFAVGWLHLTAGLFIDDMASAGIWLLEPIPFSFFRAFGFGYPGDRWWRWDEHHWPRWHTGQHWWDSGISM